MRYKTKKPSMCSKCRRAKDRLKKVGRRKTHNDERTQERKMFYELDKIFPKEYYIRNGYYSFLLSPKGQPMQYDIYYPDLQLAFEYDGIQHHEYSKFFHKNKSQFSYLQRCDKLKNKISKELGITLIRISYKEEISKETIIKKLKSSGIIGKILERGISIQ